MKDATARTAAYATSLSFLLIFAANCWAQTIPVSPAATTVTIHPGDQNVPLNVKLGSSTYTGPVVVTVTGLPSGVTIAPLTLTAGTSGTLYLSATVAAGQEGFDPTKNWGVYQTSNIVRVTATAGLTRTYTSIYLIVSISNPAFAPSPSAINLPIVNINTGGVPIVDGTTNVPGTITVTSANGETTYLPNSSDTDNTGVFHLHGNTTTAMPKKPYHVKLNTSLDLLTTIGLSCPYVTSKGKAVCDKSKSYVLLANYDDKTFLRDWSASALANAIPIGGDYLNSPADSPTPSGTSTLMPWAPHSLFVELYLNGVYEGNYQLIEEIKVDSNKVNINELAETDTTDDITGGYLVEIDKRQDEDFTWITPQGVYLGLIDPDYTTEVPEQTSYISSYTDTAEAALFGPNFTDPTLGWRAYFDEASAINYYIVMDLMGNSDGAAFFSSDYLYKSKDNPLIYMGPVWDFDISTGNTNYTAIVQPTIPYMPVYAAWYKQWFKDPGFVADTAKQWNTLKENGVFATWLNSIRQEAGTLQQSQANNFGRWPMQGIEVWPNVEAHGTYIAELDYMTDWLTVRMGYLDSVFNKKNQTSISITGVTGPLRYGAAATLQATVTGGSGPTGTVAFLSNNVILGLGALGSNGIASLTTASLVAGPASLTAVYVGDNNNALSVSTAVAETVSPSFLSTTTALSSSVSTAITGASLTFSVVVVPNSGTAVPTGTLNFIVNGLSFGSVPVATNGTATFSTAGLPAGTDLIQAVYSGDGTYKASSSNIVSVSITVDFDSGFSGDQGAFQFNGTASLSGSSIRLTDGGLQETGSAFYKIPVNVQQFATSFNFQVSDAMAAASADGFTFTFQGNGATSIGAGTGGLGFWGMPKSVGIKFDLYNNSGEGPDSTGMYLNGAVPTLPAVNLSNTGINLHSGDIIKAQLSYGGSTLTVTLTDTVTNATATQTYTVNIPATVGGNTAYVGFTGATGGYTSVQQILNWIYQ